MPLLPGFIQLDLFPRSLRYSFSCSAFCRNCAFLSIVFVVRLAQLHFAQSLFQTYIDLSTDSLDQTLNIQ